MTKVVISAVAQDDLDDIWFHIAAESPVSADRFIDRLIEVASGTLGTAPLAGRAREVYGSGLSSLAVENYAVFYRVKGSTAEIVRIRHGAHDFDSIFDA